MKRQEAFERIEIERERQEWLHKENTCAWEIPDTLKLAILAEEFGEVAKAMLENHGLAEELVQTAAVCVAWLEALESPVGR